MSLSKLYPYVKFHFVFKNPLTIGSFFHFKDSLPELMRSSVIYKFTCPGCDSGSYIGSTNRLLKVRIDSHRGVSHKTGITLGRKEFSSPRDHCRSCKQTVQYKDFKILAQANTRTSLLFLESLYIKQHSPNLDESSSAMLLRILQYFPCLLIF